MAAGPGLAMKMTADTVGISRGINRTEKLLGQLTRSTRSATSAMRGLVAIEVGKIVAGGFAAATSAISSYVSNIRTTVDETAKLARRTGIAVEALQGFQVAAGLSGVQNLEGAVQRLTISIGDAGQGNKTAQEAFDRLGLSFEELATLSPEDQFRAVSAAISELPSQAERAAAAADLFGRTGVELLPMFESNLQAIEERAQRLGIILSGPQTEAIEEMNDALSLVQQTFEGIIGQVTANLAPVVTALAEDFLSFIEGYQGLGDGTGGTALADSITEALFDGAEYLADIFDYFMEQVGGFAGIMQGVSAVFEFTANAFTAVAETLRTIFNVFEMIGNAIMLGLGKILEGLGAWVSSDLEQAGKDLAASSTSSLMKNAAEAGDAAAHAFNAALGQRNFGREGGGGSGMFGSAVREARASRNSPEAMAQREADRAAREAERQAAAEARKEAERKKKLEEAEKERLKKQEELDKKLSDMRTNLAIKEFQYEMKNAEDLAAVNQKALEASDIRSGGIAGVIAMATGREDPAVVEARKQLKELQALRASVDGLGNVVEIVGAA